MDYLPNHVAASAFPGSATELGSYAAVILSDIGANTLLLHPDTFERSEPRPDRLAAIAEYVAGGGGLVMVGGYLTFAGIEGRARWAGTPVERVLPVTIASIDDRVEVPAGVEPDVRLPGHPSVEGMPKSLAGAPGLQPRHAATGRRGRRRRRRGTRSSSSVTMGADGALRSRPIAGRTGARRRSWPGTDIRRCGSGSSAGWPRG